MLESLFSLFPVFLLDLNLGLHQHEDRVLTDAEILGEGLLQEVVGCTHVARITVDHGSKHVSLNHRWVLVQAVVDLSEGSRGIVVEPPGLSEENLSLGESRVLLSDVLKELDGLHEVFRGSR